MSGVQWIGREKWATECCVRIELRATDEFHLFCTAEYRTDKMKMPSSPQFGAFLLVNWVVYLICPVA
jgi:hypothetical protein